MGKTTLGGRRVSGQVFCSSKHRVREQNASKALCWVNLTRPGTRPDLQHYLNLTFLSPGPCLQCMLLLFVFSMETPPPQDLSIPCGRCRTLESEPMTSGHSHHSLSNGNRWEAFAFSLLVLLGHFGFCSSSASRFWGQEAARILAASAWELVPSSSSEESPPPPSVWGATASLWRGGEVEGKETTGQWVTRQT